MLKARSLILIFSLSLVGTISYSQSFSPAQKFLGETAKRRVLSSKAHDPMTADPQLTIHFYWTSWCEFCEKAYNSLVDLQNEPAFKNKIQVVGYCLDATMNDKVQAKLKAMDKIDQYLLAPAIIKEIPEFGRMPAFVVEDRKSKKMEAYTGFSNERFQYLRKFVAKSLKSENFNEE